ncbi:hypothetical protein PoB_002914600 [Plakobranchus ocellatus]|uniref:SMB domain-containing protein n=1 Tax=Plakobranchus ocellatus TaxID=259542 RepID=A0AAV4A7J3_9GAST|nr:hypothetical protein PoB_002914600 [Plakobranchus ocellatus]
MALYKHHQLTEAAIMMLLSAPILLCSSGVLLPSNCTGRPDASNGTLSTLFLQIDLERNTTMRRSKVLSGGQMLHSCQENFGTCNTSLNNSYPEGWPREARISLSPYNGTNNRPSDCSHITKQSKELEEFEAENNEKNAIELSMLSRSSLVKRNPTGLFTTSNTSVHLKRSINNSLTGILEDYTDFNNTKMLTTKQKHSLTESGLEQATAPIMRDDEDSLDLFLTFTCQGRCGEKRSFPCSCSLTCVVYGTCCENMTQDCPHEWNEGLTRFDHIRTADFICSENAIYTIISCPKKNERIVEGSQIEPTAGNKQMLGIETKSLESQNRFLSRVATTTRRNHVIEDNFTDPIVLKENHTESISGRLFAALAAAPVTDSDTGLTFINKTVYNCHSLPESNALQWQIWLKYTYSSPRTLEDFLKHQSLSNYQPNFNKGIFMDHLCDPNIQQTCDKNANLEETFAMYANKCHESNDAVVLSHNPPYAFYRNRFCAYCNEGKHTEYQLFLTERSFSSEFSFHLLLSLTKANTVSLKLNRPELEIFRLPWSQATCPVQDQGASELASPARKSGQEIETRCSATCDDPSFTLQSDGMCKAPHQALLALADDGLTPLCPAAMTGLAQFVVCGLRQEIENLKIANVTASSVYVAFDSSLNRSLYLLPLHMALPEQSRFIFSDNLADIIKNIFSVALLTKSLHHYRTSHIICPQGEEDREKAVTQTFESSSLFLFVTRKTQDLAQGMEEIRGPVVDNQTTTTVCLTATYDANMKPAPLLCMDDPVRERDSVWISRFSSSSCFQYLNNLKSNTKNEAATVKGRHDILLQYTIFACLLTSAMRQLF